MKRTRLICLLIAAVLIFSLAAAGTAAGQEAIKLKFSTAAPTTSSWHPGAEKFAALVTERTKGKFAITIYPRDELSGGNQAAGIELLQIGATDIHLQDALVWSSIAKKSIIPCFPWLLPTNAEVDKYVMNGEGGKALRQIISDAGCVCLAVGENGYRQVANNRNPIKMPEDMKGLKIRVPGSNVHVNLLKYIGADPLTMNQSEVYTSLQQGAIDACENTLDLLFTQNTLEVVSHLTLWNYSYDPLFLSVSNKLWNSLSDEEKVIFQECAEEAMKHQVKAARETVESLMKNFGKYPKVQVVTSLTEDQVAAFKKAVAPIYEDYRKTFGEDLFAKFGYTF